MAKRRLEELKLQAVLESLKPENLQDKNILEEYAKISQQYKPTTNNLGLPIEIDLEREQIEQEEEISHESLAKRSRTHEENYEYVKQKREQAELEQIQIGLREQQSNRKNDSNIETTIKNLKLTEIKNEFKLEIFEDEEANESDNEIYSDPRFNLIFFDNYPDLPIRNYRAQILNRLEKTNIVIIQGNTGCGKTTQVPQMILDHAASHNRHCNICVTQPRRLAAVSVCKRVCDERNWPIGSICGFKFQTERQLSSKTRIIYLTTGSLIQSLIANENYINKYTHIILDEIHERDLDTDLILLLLKIKLLQGYQGKVILMSATLDPKIFQDYFKKESKFSNIIARNNYEIPVIECTFSRFEVELFYLEDIKQILELDDKEMPELKEPELTNQTIEITAKLLRYFDQLEIESEEETIDGFVCNRGSVLIFISGLSDIDRLDNYLREVMPDSKLIVRGLHSDFDIKQQAEVFLNCSAGYRKVIISTSIAESSITVPDVKYVIDFCLTKSMYCDPLTNYSELRCEWATESNMNQRRGRVGRVSNGKCYRLITTNFMKNNINKHPIPAIEKQPLDKLILNLKRLQPKREPTYLLSLALTNPRIDDIERTMIVLKEVGAISLYKDGVLSAVDGEVTYAGSIMVNLPVDIRLAKLIIFGHAFGKLKEAIIIAASLSVKDLYTKNFRSNLEAYKTKFAYSQGLFCDFNCIVNTYNLFESEFPDTYGRYRSKREAEQVRHLKEEWCKSNCVQLRRIEELRKIKYEIEKRLIEQHNIKYDNNRHLKKEYDADFTEDDAVDQYYIIKLMVAAAFYPNYFQTNELNQDYVIRELNCKNPRNTVRIKNLPKNQYLPENSPILYHKKIKRAYNHCASNLIIHYDRDKAFIEFRNANDEFNHLTKVSPGVYFAICMRQLRIQIDLPLLENSAGNKNILREIETKKAIESNRYASHVSQRITIDSDQDSLSDPNLLIKDMNEFKLAVTEIIGFGHFYAQINSDDSRKKLEFIQTELNRSSFKPKHLSANKIFIGKLVATIFILNEDEILIYRAKVTKILKNFVEIFYVDFGNKEEKDFTCLFELNKELAEIPYHAFECKMAHVRLNPFRASDKEYVEKAKQEFIHLIENCESNLFGKVYSIIDNVVRMDLFDVKSDFFKYNIAHKLVKLEVCEKCDEDQYSQDMHRERMNTPKNKLYNQNKNTNEWITVKDLEKLIDKAKFLPIDRENKISLKGAESPLEIKCRPLLKRNRSITRVRISQSSINYVLLDDEPEIECSSLLVAHKIENSQHDQLELKLRNTCLFPKRCGIVSLCLMLFAPAVELRVNHKTKKSYSGVLCGLGYDKHINCALLPDNDIENVFEVEFDSKDIDDINFLRETFNKIIGSETTGKCFLANENNDNLNRQRKVINDTILKLMKRERAKIDPVYFTREYRWDQYNDECYFDHGFEKYRCDEKLRRLNKSCFIHIRKIQFSSYAKYEKKYHKYK